MPYPISAPGGRPKVPATLIVAASDSKDTSRADYVCDGTNDEEEINQAISDLPASGGRVVLLEGTYNLGNSITINKSNVTLEGQGASTVIKFKDGINTSSLDAISAGSNVHIRNLSLDGNKDNAGITNSTGIRISTGSIVENCRISNFTYAGIYVEDGSTLVYGNHISSIDTYGIYVKTLTLSGSNIISNRIEGADYGISVGQSLHVIVTNNFISGSAGNTYGIYVNGSFTINAIKTLVSNNIINNYNTCIYIGSQTLYVRVTDNEFYNYTNRIINESTSVIFECETINKGNTSSTTVTETSETLKQSVSPLNYMYYVDGIHVVANNPSGSGVTLYFKVKAELDDGSEVELASQSVSEGDSFDSWLRWICDSVTNQRVIKSIKLYAYCSDTPASGYEPTVQLERVTGLQG